MRTKMSGNGGSKQIADDAKCGAKLASFAGAPANLPEMPIWKKAPPSKNSWKKFKGTCNSCGTRGRKAVDCRRGQGQKTVDISHRTQEYIEFGLVRFGSVSVSLTFWGELMASAQRPSGQAYQSPATYLCILRA
jgi:hypothetical protein